MASSGSFVPWLEQRMSALPFVGGRVAKLQGKALGQWNRKMMQSVAPEGAQITSAGNEGFQQLQKAYADAYGAIWNQRIPLASNPSQAWADMLPSIAKTVSKKDFKAVMRNLTQVDEVLKVAHHLARVGQNNGNVLSQIDDMLRGLIKQAQRKGDDQEVAACQQARKSFREALPPQVVQRLAALDGQYAKYAIVQKAGTYKKAFESDSRTLAPTTTATRPMAAAHMLEFPSKLGPLLSHNRPTDRGEISMCL